MAWETRNGNSYYYRKRRIGNRVVSEYLGGGTMATMAAMMDEANQEQQALDRQAMKAEREAQRVIDRQINEVIAKGRLLATAHLLVNNYHRHRGSWRRRREPIEA